jgi:molybdenum cofactor cytidylyltransferase
MNARAVILAAGRSSRMGSGQKLLMPYRGRLMIEYALDAAKEWSPLVIAGEEVAKALVAHAAQFRLNRSPERGMSYSLKIADEAVEQEAALIVLLGDKPLVTADLIRMLLDQLHDEADVVYPVRESQPGHPVIFAPRARNRIAALADGDTLRALRDDPELTRVEVAVEDPGPFVDIDTPGDLANGE